MWKMEALKHLNIFLLKSNFGFRVLCEQVGDERAFKIHQDRIMVSVIIFIVIVIVVAFVDRCCSRSFKEHFHKFFEGGTKVEKQRIRSKSI